MKKKISVLFMIVIACSLLHAQSGASSLQSSAAAIDMVGLVPQQQYRFSISYENPDGFQETENGNRTSGIFELRTSGSMLSQNYNIEITCTDLRMPYQLNAPRQLAIRPAILMDLSSQSLSNTITMSSYPIKGYKDSDIIASFQLQWERAPERMISLMEQDDVRYMADISIDIAAM